MYARLVVSVAVAFLLRGTHAKCKTQQETQAMMNAGMANLSQSCRVTTGGDSGNAPNCNQANTACTMKMSVTTTMTCSGPMCSFMSEMVKPRTVAQEPVICYPDACRNGADAATFLGVSMAQTVGASCAAMSNSVTTNMTGANLSLSSVDVDGMQLVCSGQVVGSIGTIKPATPMPTAMPSPMPTTMPAAASTSQTCKDVKASYQAQGCCTSPTKTFVMSGESSSMSANRGRLLGDRKEALLDSMKEMFEQARAEGTHIQAAQEIIDMLKGHVAK